MVADKKDLAGNVLKVGDRVAYSAGGRYHTFDLYTVAGFTPNLVRLEKPSKIRADCVIKQNAHPGSLVCIREPANG
jgi:hypothetical protein